ncbi:MAG: hypothetical protein KIT86_02410 [Hydrogenophaga sp.]|uniref:hypothetical protein n=1 Tax=Hydrogenophaga sp. TaxID=1904254 RepID=UPI002617E405|nr:hypothetical protein [Hydrogenophaga sp.]MCW5668483.1 hypothetical protein [Hydrogenophaga sp.]
MSRATSRFAAAALFAMVCLSSLPVQAASDGQRKPPSKVTFHRAPSEEAPAAREKRLQRECKGRANAGMCMGYTR